MNDSPILSYKRFKPSEAFDAIIIGSGLGSLTTAAMLSKEGKKVLVLEQHYQAGGYTQIFKRRGYEWDVGIHYVGETHRPYTFISKLFNYITNHQLKWSYMGEVYDKIYFGEELFELRAGKDNFIEQMKIYFPDLKDQQAIDQYVELVYAAARSAGSFIAEKALPSSAAFLMGNSLRKKALTYTQKSTLSVLKSLTNNPKLIGVLCGQYGDYGLPPAQSSFFMHAVLVKHYMNGGNFPIGGSSQVVETIAPVIAESGGKILTLAKVENIIIHKNKAVGVRMEDGVEINAPIIVSGAGVMNTYKSLLPSETQDKHQLITKSKQVKPSVSHVCLYTGFEQSTSDLELKKPNYWIYPEGKYDHDQLVADFNNNPENDLPVVYLSFPSAKDPDWDNRYPNKSTIDIITMAPYAWFAKWEDTRWKKRGNEYEEKKAYFSERLLNTMYQYLPQLKGKVDYHELSTPLSNRHFCNYAQGEIYGIDHTPKRFDQRFLKATSPIKNLFLTGQDIVTVGIGAALASGAVTASAILKKDLTKKIRNL